MHAMFINVLFECFLFFMKWYKETITHDYFNSLEVLYLCTKSGLTNFQDTPMYSISIGILEHLLFISALGYRYKRKA